MISIVIVSHSRQLAMGVMELASQMSQGQVQIAVAAGIDDPDNPIGTDPIAVMSAIEEVSSPEGTLVLVDMGSAILSTDMALELLDEETTDLVHVCAAPLVEGAIAATVAAAAELPMRDVLNETHNAIVSKYQVLEQQDLLPFGDSEPEDEKVGGHKSKASFSWKIQNPSGIHARPASAIVALANKFDADMQLSVGDKRANAKSMNSIVLLGAKESDTITCDTDGVEAKQALDAFIDLAKDNFGDDINPIRPPTATHNTLQTSKSPPTDQSALTGLPVSGGIAKARVFVFERFDADFSGRQFSGDSAEAERLEEAIKKADAELELLVHSVADKLSETEADIFRAHQQLLTDPDLKDTVQEKIFSERVCAEQAWFEEIEDMAEAYRCISDTYMAERANDVMDIGHRVIRILMGQSDSLHTFTQPKVLVAGNLFPSETAKLDPDVIKGICLEQGSDNSHSAILARAMGIPMVSELDGIVRRANEQMEIMLDGEQGTVWLEPSNFS